MNGFVIRMDPFEMESRFSEERILNYEESNDLTYEDFVPFLDRLPSKERDLIELYYYCGKKQKEIADMYSMTQGAVSHRLSRASKRLKFLRDMPKLDTDVRRLLEPYFNNLEIDLIAFMIETTCQSKTAELLNLKYNYEGNNRMTQVKVRHRFSRCIEKLKKLKNKHKELCNCYALLVYIRDNLYMLHEVILPHFKRPAHVKFNDLR